VRYISAIWGADLFGPISTNFGTLVGVDDIIIQFNFGFIISGVPDLQQLKISVFTLTLLATVRRATVLPLRGACELIIGTKTYLFVISRWRNYCLVAAPSGDYK